MFTYRDDGRLKSFLVELNSANQSAIIPTGATLIVKNQSPEKRTLSELEESVLEAIAVLETPETPLEEAIANYEKGVDLIRKAQELLTVAEQQVSQLSPTKVDALTDA